jgi:AGCS family alanine or glycine:cation symporter
MSGFDAFIATANAILWHDFVLYALLASGLLFTVRSRFCQYQALTHGVRVVRGAYDNPGDPGAINHFQALAAALSATVGLGNIGGVAIAISLGGPGAVFWMWVVGIIGMALKTTEVTLVMLYRNVEQPDNPHGGSMWVLSKAIARRSPRFAPLGRLLGALFCCTLLVMVVAGGNMFQAWNVGEITQSYFGVPSIFSGIVLATVVGLVIIGGIRRIGTVAGVLAPVMVAMYFLGAVYVLVAHWRDIPGMFALIFRGAFGPLEANNAFIGGTMGYAFLYGLKRAFFSNEAGQGTSPIAHSAARTGEPVREALVAGLEPFIDTLVVCTLTALVIIATGIWQRPAEAQFADLPQFSRTAEGQWQLPVTPAPARAGASAWQGAESVFVVVSADPNPASGNSLHRLAGTIEILGGTPQVRWSPLSAATTPRLADPGLYVSYVGATLTARAFDAVTPGLGQWLVTLAVWLFALSTMISYSYYAEQGVIYLAGERAVAPFKLLYCLLPILATAGFLRTDAQLDNLSGLGTALMLWVNIPMLWFLGHEAMAAYHDYTRRLKSGEMGPGHATEPLASLMSGHGSGDGGDDGRDHQRR